MPLSVQVVDRPEELARRRAQWDELVARSADPQPTVAPDWLLAWWREFGRDGGRKLRAVLVFDRGRLVGLAPLLARTFWYRPGIPFRRIELLGSGEAEEDEIMSEYIGVVAERGREEEVAGSLAAELCGGQLAPWDELVCERMNGDAPQTGALTRALVARGLSVETVEKAVSFYAPLTGSFDQYLESLPSSRRYRIKRALRDFEHWTGGAYRLCRATDRESLERGFRILTDLHGTRWHASGRIGAFSSPRFRRFHSQVMPALFDRGALDLWWLEVKEEPVAALYNIVWDGKVQFYQSGRRVDLPKKIKPGTVIHMLAIQRAIEKGRLEYDFLAGDARYKEELTLAARPLLSMRATRVLSLREGARRLVTRGVDRAREVRRALRERAEQS